AFGCDNSTSVEQIESEKPYILWGMGDQISGAKNSPVFQEAPVGMVTSWFNKPDDLNWMNGYKDETTMSNLYHQGYAQELVVWLADYPDYAISPKFQEDIVELTKIFKGNGPDYGPLYVVLFTEFETYSDDPDYFIKLKDAFMQARQSIKQEYGQASIALGFGGYGWIGQAERDLKTWEIEAIEAGDFAAVQHMHHADRLDLMIPQVRRSVKQLGSYGKPVMVSHFKLWGNEGDPAGLPSQSFNNFISNIFTLQSLQALSDDGLFAWGFMDDTYINDPGTARNRIVEIISRHTDPDSELPNQ
ncbi:MAG: hypothetical protein ACNS64_02365, partial [Candidatus Halalkalibacterium sp. M3_1C_030]